MKAKFKKDHRGYVFRDEHGHRWPAYTSKALSSNIDRVWIADVDGIELRHGEVYRLVRLKRALRRHRAVLWTVVGGVAAEAARVLSEHVH